MADATYSRSRDGKTIHRPCGCHYACPPFGIEWEWAKGKTVADIRYQATIWHIKYRWCRRCFPELLPQVAP